MDVEKAINDAAYIDVLAEWVLAQSGDALAPLVYATMPPEALKAVQERLVANVQALPSKICSGSLRNVSKPKGLRASLLQAEKHPGL